MQWKKQEEKVQVVLILCTLRENKWTLERCTEFSLRSVKIAFKNRVSADS